ARRKNKINSDYKINMAHIHEKIDFTVTCFILHPSEPKVLLIHHKAHNSWLPVGGHIELDEDPDQALLREVEEECGLGIEIFSEKSPGEYPETKMLRRPDTVDIHTINDAGHRHVNFGYSARALSAEPKLAPEEHHDIKWFSAEELRDENLNIKPAIRDYALGFLKKFG
ncbi:MAG: NUDIX domain-containing protein, partial [Candidatus Magasanikbacteria bacterium]|nr:NUDIX domain-containing protein [Candidatus Magasanikbacteria bacterium]